MPDRKLAGSRLLRSRHGEFSNLGARAVGTENDGSMDDGAVAEHGDYAVAAFVECKVDEILIVLTEGRGNISFKPSSVKTAVVILS